MEERRPNALKKLDRRQLRIGAVLAAVLLIALVAWLVLGGGGDSSSSESPGSPEAASLESLRETAAQNGTPIYWAGPQPGADLEVTNSDGGEQVYVRYLTGGAEAGDPRADFLTVGTYRFPDAAGALRRQARESGGRLRTAPGGGVVYVGPGHPQSVYLAFPGVEVEIEVYDPDPKRALNLVTAGQIVPVS